MNTGKLALHDLMFWQLQWSHPLVICLMSVPDDEPPAPFRVYSSGVDTIEHGDLQFLASGKVTVCYGR